MVGYYATSIDFDERRPRRTEVAIVRAHWSATHMVHPTVTKKPRRKTAQYGPDIMSTGLIRDPDPEGLLRRGFATRPAVPVIITPK